MSCSEIISKEKELIFNTYARYPICISHGIGNKLFDINGKEYLDMLSGIAVCNLGHANEEIRETISNQASKLLHVSNLFYTKEQIDLAKELLATTDHLKKVFFCNSGAEANEAAIKLARRYMQKVKNQERYEIITLEGSFHGRTYATMSATGQEKIKDGFSPLVPGFLHAKTNNIEDIRGKVSEKTAAIMIEVVQGEGGVRPLDKKFVLELYNLCISEGLILIVDEIQTGMGRTGKWWGFQHYGIKPHIVTCAKALANGLPMGCMMSTEEISKGFSPGAHATTFGGGPLVCSAALKVLEIIKRDNLLEHVTKVGEYTLFLLNDLKKQYVHVIKEVRGLGLMIGIEIVDEKTASNIFNLLLEKGIIVNLTQQKILRLLPPLTITKQEISYFVSVLEKIIANL